MSGRLLVPRRVALRRLVAGGLAVAGLASGRTALADAPRPATLGQAVAEIARIMSRVVKDAGGREIVVNPITDTGDLTHTSGPGVTDQLIDRLKAEGLEPALKTDLVFTGSYAVGEAETNGRRQGIPVARIDFQVRHRDGRVVFDSRRDLDVEHQPLVTNPADIQVLGGGTAFLPPAAPAEENNRRILDGLDNKPGLFEIDGAAVRPKGAPYAVAMLVAPRPAGDRAPARSSFRPRAVTVRNGFPFLKVEPGEVVAVRITNDADHDVACTVTIDGLNIFAFRDNKADTANRVVVGAHGSGEVLGWFRNDETSSVFLVSELPQDHPRAGLLKNPARIGSITVTFAAAWESNGQRPPDEPPTRQAAEIVPGAPIEAPYRKVQRQVGVHRAAVTVRYDR